MSQISRNCVIPSMSYKNMSICISLLVFESTRVSAVQTKVLYQHKTICIHPRVLKEAADYLVVPLKNVIRHSFEIGELPLD